MATLKRSKDRKVANSFYMSKPKDPSKAPKPEVWIANAFGLPSGQGFSCPDATAFCAEICYAGNLEVLYKGVLAVLQHNWDLVKDASLEDTTVLLSEMIASFVKDCAKRKAPKLFRIHWDGDFFSGTYTAAWARVIRDNPDVQFWAYTRVQTAAMFLHSQKLSNLALYFSGDRDNVDIARFLQGKGINVAYVDTTFDEGKAQFPGAVRCPENNGALPLINDKGSACAQCGLCINGRKSVLFSTTKK